MEFVFMFKLQIDLLDLVLILIHKLIKLTPILNLKYSGGLLPNFNFDASIDNFVLYSKGSASNSIDNCFLLS